MEFDDDIKMGDLESSKIDFSGVAHGKSKWCRTNSERVSMMQAFKRFEEKANTGLKAISRAVGMDDPKGAGYRVWFMREPEAIKPGVMSRLPQWDALDEIQQTRLAYSGVECADDIMEAVRSIGLEMKTIGDANMARKMIHAWKTPLQIEYMKRHGRANQEELQASSDARINAINAVPEWPADDGRTVTPSYEELTDEQRRKLAGEPRVSNEEEYLKAMRWELTHRPKLKALHTVMEGYGEYTRWKNVNGRRLGLL